MALLDTGPTLYKPMGESVIATEQHKPVEQPVRWAPHYSAYSLKMTPGDHVHIITHRKSTKWKTQDVLKNLNGTQVWQHMARTEK